MISPDRFWKDVSKRWHSLFSAVRRFFASHSQRPQEPLLIPYVPAAADTVHFQNPAKSFIDYTATTGMQTGSCSLDLPLLKPNQQYRYHYDATACVGCHGCESACNMQNRNSHEVKWRRVGELHGGEFPNYRQLFNSMSCNHCIEPACLAGCPTNSYKKLDNGIVFHNDDSCMGCQYCTWNCPYQAPAYDASKGIVTKCHMCHERIGIGQTPACVQACPSGALSIEIIDKEHWVREDLTQQGVAPHLPDIAFTKPTTRYTLPQNLPVLHPMDEHILHKAHGELPLVFMTVFTQISLGASATVVLGQIASLFSGALPKPNLISMICVVVPLMVGLPLSALHLGRPFLAVAAFLNLKTSWLSREAFWLGNFMGVAVVHMVAFYLNLPMFIQVPLGLASLGAGLVGIYPQSMIYRVKSRPAWNRTGTTISFFGTSYLGFLVVALTLAVYRQNFASIIIMSTLLGAVVINNVITELRSYGNLHKDDPAYYQLSRTKRLFDSQKHLVRLRVAFLILGAILLPILATTAFDAKMNILSTGLLSLAILAGTVGELIGRYLFYILTVPYGLAGNFFAGNQRH